MQNDAGIACFASKSSTRGVATIVNSPRESALGLFDLPVPIQLDMPSTSNVRQQLNRAMSLSRFERNRDATPRCRVGNKRDLIQDLQAAERQSWQRCFRSTRTSSAVSRRSKWSVMRRI